MHIASGERARGETHKATYVSHFTNLSTIYHFLTLVKISAPVGISLVAGASGPTGALAYHLGDFDSYIQQGS
jgi:hypothetical protein